MTEAELLEFAKKVAAELPAPPLTQKINTGMGLQDIKLPCEVRYKFVGRTPDSWLVVQPGPEPESCLEFRPDAMPKSVPLPEKVWLKLQIWKRDDGRMVRLLIGSRDELIDDEEAEQIWPGTKKLIRTIYFGEQI
jgi:hypothetical protein